MALNRSWRRTARSERYRWATGLVLLALLLGAGTGLLSELALGARGEGMAVVLLLVDDRVYQPEDDVEVNFYFQRDGERINPDEAPVLQINPDTTSDGRESREVSSRWEDSGHYSAYFQLRDTDYGNLESVYLYVSVKVKGQQVEDFDYLDIDVGSHPYVIDLRLSHLEALPGDEVMATLTARDRTRGDEPLDMEDLEFSYRLPGADQQTSLDFEQITGRATASLRVPGNQDEAGALTFTAQGKVGDESAFTRYATVWVPLLRIWFHGVNLESDTAAFELWTADQEGVPVSGVDLELEYRIYDEDDKLLREGDLTGVTGTGGGKRFNLNRPGGAHELRLTGSARHDLANRDFVFDWNLAQVSTSGYRLEPVYDRFHNQSYFPDSRVTIPLRVLRDGAPHASSSGTVVAFSSVALLHEDRVETNSAGLFELILDLPERTGTVHVVIFDLADGGLAYWDLMVRDLRVNLTVERFNLAGPTNLSLELPRELSHTEPNQGFPRLRLETDEADSGLGWYPVADPANEAIQPRYHLLAPELVPGNATTQSLFQLTLPGFLPQEGKVRFAIEALDRERGRETTGYWVLQPGESTADLPGPPEPIATEGDDTPWEWYTGALISIVVLLSVVLMVALRRRKGQEEADDRESWEMPVAAQGDQKTTTPQPPSEPYYGAPAAAPPPLSILACPHCGNSMGVVLQPGQQVLVACPHCSGQSRVG